MRRGYVTPEDTPNLKYWERWWEPLGPTFHHKYKLVVAGACGSSRFHLDDRFLGDKAPHVMYIHMDNSHIAHIIHGDVYLDVTNTKEFQRLVDVRSLGATEFTYPGASHGRSLHSILAAIMMEYALRRNGFPERDVNLGIIAALLHDIATPPLSDYGKLACPAELDEEDNVEFVLGDKFDETFRKYGVTREDVVDVIRGRGTVGKLLNSRGVDLDKIAYTGVDISKSYTDVASQVLRRDPFLFDLYEDVSVIDGVPVITDPERLSRFLLARALVSAEVYTSSENRLRAAYFKPVFERVWRGVDKEELLKMGDGVFWQMLGPYGITLASAAQIWGEYKEVGLYETREEAEANSQDGDLVHGFLRSNPATGTLTMVDGRRRFGRIEDGEVVQFKEAFPKEAERVEKIMDRTGYFSVHRRVVDARI